MFSAPGVPPREGLENEMLAVASVSWLAIPLPVADLLHVVGLSVADHR